MDFLGRVHNLPSRVLRWRTVLWLLLLLIGSERSPVWGQNRYATSDNLSGYVHWIDLYDENNSKIDPKAENPKPYSPEKTCGRCHDFATISHGWHFNATEENVDHGRPGQPWIWGDERTGTYLPLSYRGWHGTYDPDELGLTRWQVAAKLGSYLPGGGVGSEASLTSQEESTTDEDANRFKITGGLPVDCMMCHHNTGSGYSPFQWSEQIADENFRYAPTAALGLGVVSGNMTRLKGDFDPNSEDAAAKLPKLTYETGRFRTDGKVFFDLVRKPKNDACYYCHTNVTADFAQGQRWLHDEDVHVRAGMACADCHRNSLDHHTVRGFTGESHEAGSLVAAFSCQGCHLGEGSHEAGEPWSAGRLGAPRPEHRGLPPLHFEKLTCTACHSGPMPAEEVPRQLNSIGHKLGEHVKRTGDEMPGIVGALNLPVDYSAYLGTLEQNDAQHQSSAAKTYTPHRMMWPSFWGILLDGKVVALNPEEVYELIRRPLKVRRDFVGELGEVRLSLSQRKELLGDDRARVREEEYTAEEREKLLAAETAERQTQVNERMSAALEAIEEEYPDSQAIFVSAGVGFVRKAEGELEQVEKTVLGDAALPYAWPVAHNVRPAQQSLGKGGCTECHSDNSLFFQAQVTPVGLVPGQKVPPIKVHELQEADMPRLTTWNQLFAGRSLFKVLGLIALGVTCLLVVSAMSWNLTRLIRR